MVKVDRCTFSRPYINGAKLGVFTSCAEVIAVFIWPVFLSFIAFYAALKIAGELGGKPSIIVTFVLALATFRMLLLFSNGSIDHHNAQSALGLLFVMAVVALKPSQKSGLLAAICLTLMTAIGVETQAHVVVGGLAIALLFVFQGKRFNHFVFGFGCTFAAANLVIFFATIAPVNYVRPTCDAFSIAQALPSFVAGLSLGLAAYFLREKWDIKRRLLALSAVGAVSIFAIIPASLGCIANPLGAIDPLVYKFWLVDVAEAEPLITVMKEDLFLALAFTAPACIAVLSALYLFYKSPSHRLAAITIGILCVLSIAISIYQFRGIVFAAHIAVPLLGITSGLLYKWANSVGKNIAHRLLVVCFIAACFNQTWAVATLALSEETYAPVAENIPNEKTCSGPAFIASLNAIPKTTFMAIPNLGPDILIDTPHRVLSGPYHRNIEGIRATILAHIRSSDQSKKIMIDSRATHYVWCPGASATLKYSKENGFAADMQSGKVPNWLSLVTAAPDSSYAIYKINN